MAEKPSTNFVIDPLAAHLNNASMLDIGRNNFSGWSRNGAKLSRS
ncbi:hypothetical protein M2322_004431 [Rhodoblastus acidophilus]|nr:hypothetical protein [Rhodoblastus acidophilus]